MELNNAKLLDCTLRDGAYLIDKKFGDETIIGIIDGLNKANIDIIEIGFLQDEGFGEGKTVYKNSKDCEKYIKSKNDKTMYTVLADYSRYSIENLDDYTGKSFDAVRACFFKSERYDVIEFCKEIKKRGYKLFVQPVDILGYTDKELIDLIEDVNMLEPYCLSIVDTFGSMYQEDLQRVYSLIDNNLIKKSRIGFHSHNNMQMSSALSQDFLRMSYGTRNVVVDSTISGMGRGAGNTPTELVAEYMVKKLGYPYEIDAILDLIDNYMDNIRARCEWGYNTKYFIAGCYSAHVNNIKYLTQKSSIRSKDIRFILNKIGAIPRKRYHYDLLEKTYLDYVNSEVDDSNAIMALTKIFRDRNVVVIAPGKSASENAVEIQNYINKTDNPIVISVNFIHDSIKVDYLYLSNVRRYEYWKKSENFDQIRKIYTSNVINKSCDDYVVSFERLVKCGWDYMENSTILLLRLLSILGVSSIAIAGMDGYTNNLLQNQNYANKFLELANVGSNYIQMNSDIESMLKDYMNTKPRKIKVKLITPSIFSDVLGETDE